MRKGLFYSWLILFLFNELQSQQINPKSIGVYGDHGFIIPHSRTIVNVSESNPYNISIDYGVIRTDSTTWKLCNCYAKIGGGFLYTNFNNPRILGSGYTAYFFTEPYLTLTQPLFLSLRGLLGVTYLNQVYDSITNPTNLFFSAPISFLLQLNLSIHYQLSPRWSIRLMGNYNHISNGGTKEPNKGINFPSMGFGAMHTLNPTRLSPQKKYRIERNFIAYLRFYSTVTTIRADDRYPEVRLPLIGLLAGVIKPLSKINGLSLSIEFEHDLSLKEKLKRQEIASDFHIGGVLFGHHFIASRFIFSQHIGMYVYRPYPIHERRFYQRYELNYGITDWMTIGFAMKAHAHVANYLDIRLGFQLNK